MSIMHKAAHVIIPFSYKPGLQLSTNRDNRFAQTAARACPARSLTAENAEITRGIFSAESTKSSAFSALSAVKMILWSYSLCLGYDPSTRSMGAYSPKWSSARATGTSPTEPATST